MTTIGEEGSYALDAASDLIDLLRLSHGALHRLKHDIHGDCYKSADELAKKLLAIRHEADNLHQDILSYVRDIEHKKYGN